MTALHLFREDVVAIVAAENPQWAAAQPGLEIAQMGHLPVAYIAGA